MVQIEQSFRACHIVQTRTFVLIYLGLWFTHFSWLSRHPACKKTVWWGAGVVICPEWGADLHMAQLMPLPLTVFCFSKIQIGFAFLVPAHPGSPGKRAVKRVCVCVFLGQFWRQVKVYGHVMKNSSYWLCMHLTNFLHNALLVVFRVFHAKWSVWPRVRVF